MSGQQELDYLRELHETAKKLEMQATIQEKHLGSHLHGVIKVLQCIGLAYSSNKAEYKEKFISDINEYFETLFKAITNYKVALVKQGLEEQFKRHLADKSEE